MRRLLLILLLLILLCYALATPAAAADDKVKEFAATPQEVFDAALAVAKEHYTVVESNRDELLLTFWTGYSLTSNGFQVTATFENTEKGTRLKLRTAKRQQLLAWGAGGRIAKKFFGQVQEQLKAKPAPAPTPSAPPPSPRAAPGRSSAAAPAVVTSTICGGSVPGRAAAQT